MSLLIQRKKKDAPFHPRLWIRNTGYGRNQVCVRFFRHDVEIGMDTIGKYGTIQKAIEHYFSELARTGHTVYEGDVKDAIN